MAMAPVMAMPAAMPSAAVPTMMPAPTHFLRLEMIDFGLRHDGRLHGLRPRRGELPRGGRRQRRGVGDTNQRDSASRRSGGEFNESAKFHEISLPVNMSQCNECRCVGMNAR